MQARKENVLEQYELIVNDYENRVAQVKKATVKGRDTTYDKKLLDTFEQNIRSIKPDLQNKILKLELLLRRS